MLTTLPVNVPVLSKHTMLTSAAVLSLPGLSTWMPLALSLLEQAAFEHTITVGTATGKAATTVLMTCTRMLDGGTWYLVTQGTAVARSRQLCKARAKRQKRSKSCRHQNA